VVEKLALSEVERDPYSFAHCHSPQGIFPTPYTAKIRKEAIGKGTTSVVPPDAEMPFREARTRSHQTPTAKRRHNEVQGVSPE